MEQSYEIYAHIAEFNENELFVSEVILGQLIVLDTR